MKVAKHKIRFDASNLDIRETRLDDLPKIFALGEKLFTAEKWPVLYRSWDQYELVEFFLADDEFCFVADYDGEIAGFIFGTLFEKRKKAWVYGHVSWLGVSEDYKGKGIGTRLLKRLTDAFIAHGARMMLVDTDPHNNEAVAFFHKNEFENEVPHIYLSKNLTDHPHYIKQRRLSIRRKVFHRKPAKI
jgi:ribosomal protein S18 acetylase RimI-like enzyme